LSFTAGQNPRIDAAFTDEVIFAEMFAVDPHFTRLVAAQNRAVFGPFFVSVFPKHFAGIDFDFFQISHAVSSLQAHI
jgi:hypothetical protein